MLTEALNLPGCPDGYEDLCHLVMQGRLNQPAEIAAAVERLWAGLGPWSVRQNLPLERYCNWSPDLTI